MKKHLTLMTGVEDAKWDLLQREFENAHKLNPGGEPTSTAQGEPRRCGLWACMWVEGGSQICAGPGALRFRELATTVAGLVGNQDDDCQEFWLEILLGYLLQNDRQGEYIDMQAAATRRHTWIREEPGPRNHLGGVIGEKYRIRQLFKASADCCVWLRGYVKRAHKLITPGNNTISAPATVLQRRRGRRGPEPDNAGHLWTFELLGSFDWKNNLGQACRRLDDPPDGGEPVKVSKAWGKQEIKSWVHAFEEFKSESVIVKSIARRFKLGKSLAGK